MVSSITDTSTLRASYSAVNGFHGLILIESLKGFDHKGLPPKEPRSEVDEIDRFSPARVTITM